MTYDVDLECPVCGELVTSVRGVLDYGKTYYDGFFTAQEPDKLLGWTFTPCGHGARRLINELGVWSVEL